LQIIETDIPLIVQGCINNERRAQEQLYRGYYASMMSICQRFTKNEQDALAILNQGFLKVFKNVQKYESMYASLYTWIRTIIINTCLDHIKANKTHFESREIEVAHEVEIPPEVIDKMNSGELLKKIRELPPATATVFNLYVVEGYNHREIAQILQISEGTSKWHLSDARKQLQQKIKMTTI
jgi:RNA polymerase sigma factor (sigma-70 family)